MATNTNLGGVFTTDLNNPREVKVFLSTENVVGLIIDTSIAGGLEKALGTGTEAAAKFANGNVVELNTIKDIKGAGITDEVMGGLLKYHLETFFTLAKGTRRIFVSFMDSDKDPDFEAIEKMQMASSGIIYQIGVWTSKPIAKKNADGTVVVEPGSLCSKLETEAEILGGTVGVTNYEGNAPLNVIVSAPVLDEAEIDIAKLPDLSELDMPKVTVLLGQAASDTVHEIMYKVNHLQEGKTHYAPVGCIGAILGCLAVAPANESIAHVGSFNLAAVIQEAELGFGKLAETAATEGTPAGYSADASFTNINTLGYSKRNNHLHKNGYVFLTNYDGLEKSVFFSSDQTLSKGDYRSLTRCRVMHKSRRVVRRALLPRVNADWEVDVSTGSLSASATTEFQNIVIEALDLNMVEPGTTKPQISGRVCSIDPDQDVMTNDAIDIYYGLIPKGISGFIGVTESFTSTTGA